MNSKQETYDTIRARQTIDIRFNYTTNNEPFKHAQY